MMIIAMVQGGASGGASDFGFASTEVCASETAAGSSGLLLLASGISGFPHSSNSGGSSRSARG